MSQQSTKYTVFRTGDLLTLLGSTYSVISESQISREDATRLQQYSNTMISMINLQVHHSIVLCPLYFGIQTLHEQLHLIEQAPGSEKVIDNVYFNQRGAYFHELIHARLTVTSPKAWDPKYGMMDAYEAARNGSGVEISTINAESYTLAVLAMLLQQKFGLKTSPLPDLDCPYAEYNRITELNKYLTTVSFGSWAALFIMNVVLLICFANAVVFTD